jgi:hypothetical protein
MTQRGCGFYDLRLDEKGYYCCKCGQRKPHEFRRDVLLTLGKKWVQQLDEQCKVRA